MDLKEKIRLLPENPGCYIMKNSKEEIIYIGKAKKIKTRVKSYFNGNNNIKTQKLVSEIRNIEYIITNSEKEALILESNLIKKHLPRYNILLKDDKSFPYLKITKEKHPRLIITRKILKDGAEYFGPYPNAGSATEVKKILDRVYKLRKCDTIPKKVCLYYHLGQCFAPCEFVLKNEEKDTIKKIKLFLNGDTKEIKEEIKSKMIKASEELNFELANEYKIQLQDIEKTIEKQNIDSNDLKDKDVISFFSKDGWISIQIFNIRMGSIVERKVEIYKFYRDLEEEVESFIYNYYENNIKPKEVYVSENIDNNLFKELLGLNIKKPVRGKNKELVNMAYKNSIKVLEDKIYELENKEEKNEIALGKLKEKIGINSLDVIEAFDNSNIQGASPISAMVVFKNGKPSKKDYRKYKIKTVEGPDDYASMYEVITRRYEKVLSGEEKKPDLIVIDGGIGQINSAKKALKNLNLKIKIIGLSKNNKHDTDTVIDGDSLKEINIEKRSEEFYLLKRIQDEVHRFAIEFFRKTHTKNSINSALDNINGLGPKRKKILLSHFKSLSNIKKATEEELSLLGIPQKVINEIKKL